MARKRTEIGHEVEAQIKALMARGGTVLTITETLTAAGVKGISSATVGRRMRELRGAVNAERVVRRDERHGGAPGPAQVIVDGGRANLPDTPEDIPVDASLDEINYWLDVAKRTARDADDECDPDSLAKMVRLALGLLEAKRRATPLPKADPNDAPDMIAAAARVRERWHTLIDKVAASR